MHVFLRPRIFSGIALIFRWGLAYAYDESDCMRVYGKDGREIWGSGSSEILRKDLRSNAKICNNLISI